MLTHASGRCTSKAAFHSRALNPRCRSHRVVRVAASQEVKMPRWDAVYTELKRLNLETIDVEAANELVSSGEWVLVDVRPANLYNEAHPVGAVSTPLYQLIDYSNATPTTWLRGALFALNGVQATEFNPKFPDQIKALTSAGKGVIVYCEAGGSLIPSMTFATGKASRSLQAAFRILNEGLGDRVKHLGGGLYAWYKAELPMDGTYDTSNLGRTPNSAANAEFPTTSK